MSSSGDGRGMTVAYYPYTAGPFAGQVTVAAAPSGPGLGITINEDEVKKHPFQQEIVLREFSPDGAVTDW